MTHSTSVAEALIKYRTALLDAGLPPDLVNEMTRDAASRIIQSQGVGVLTVLA